VQIRLADDADGRSSAANAAVEVLLASHERILPTLDGGAVDVELPGRSAVIARVARH